MLITHFPFSSKVKIVWSYTASSLYAFMVQRLMKHMDDYLLAAFLSFIYI